MSDFSGQWFTTFGTMTLTQDGPKVQGVYQMGRSCMPLQGTVRTACCNFATVSQRGRGGLVCLAAPRQVCRAMATGWDRTLGFTGRENAASRASGKARSAPCGSCRGRRSAGFLRRARHVRPSSGKLRATGLEFRYQEPAVGGEGWFELAENGTSFQGQWRPDGTEAWAPWQGQRLVPVPGLVWLVVLEAYWQRGLGEKEYAFGNMLREFFARVPHIEVRQRFFNNEAGLAKWCRELLYLPEPIAWSWPRTAPRKD